MLNCTLKEYDFRAVLITVCTSVLHNYSVFVAVFSAVFLIVFIAVFIVVSTAVVVLWPFFCFYSSLVAV